MPENVVAQRPFLAFSSALSLACVLHLWLSRRGSLWRKAFWSLAVWLPLLGPVVYATLYRIPRRKPDSEISETGCQY